MTSMSSLSVQSVFPSVSLFFCFSISVSLSLYSYEFKTSTQTQYINIFAVCPLSAFMQWVTIWKWTRLLGHTVYCLCTIKNDIYIVSINPPFRSPCVGLRCPLCLSFSFSVSLSLYHSLFTPTNSKQAHRHNIYKYIYCMAIVYFYVLSRYMKMDFFDIQYTVCVQ